MTVENTMEVLEFRLQKLGAQEACRNLMGKYSYYHTATRNLDYIELWAKRDDDLLKMPWGEYEGFEGVKACYLKDHGDRTFPDTYESMKGGVFMHEMDTEIIEVAADCQTARATFLSQGHETYCFDHEETAKATAENGGDLTRIRSEKATCEWSWSKYAVDFIKDTDGQWKFWHMRLYPLFKAPYGKSYVDAVQPQHQDFTCPEAKKADSMWVYSPDEVYPANQPEPPKAYKTFADDGITSERGGQSHD